MIVNIPDVTIEAIRASVQRNAPVVAGETLMEIAGNYAERAGELSALLRVLLHYVDAPQS